MKLPKEYYPTPENLAWDMVKKIDWEKSNGCILEPSAGTGELCEVYQKFLKMKYYHREENYDIDCIEKSPELRSILVGKGYRVVHDDFLTFKTLKKYGVIIMNPPFSEGDKHLLKAIEMQKSGGQIICLLNAETLKNQCTNARKALGNLLQEYGAEIEYRKEAFKNADRRTAVEVALVYVSIPYTQKSDIFENLKKSHSISEQNEDLEGIGYLAKGDIIDSLVDQFYLESEAGTQLIKEFNALSPQMLNSFTNGYPILNLQVGNHPASINGFLKAVRYKYWEAFLQSDKILKLCTEELQKEYLGRLRELKNYDFTKPNIIQVMSDMNRHMLQSIDNTILRLFEEFSYTYSMEKQGNIHYYNGWKTNKAYIVQKKVILLLNAWSEWFHRFDYNYDVVRKLLDIEKVFNYLDDGTTDGPDLTDTLRKCQEEQATKDIKLKYFTATFYKKGTCHLTFTNERLLKKFNIFGSQKKGWLPPAYGKKKYSDLSKEEKAVVDDFEGKASYSETFQNLEYYLNPTGSLLMLGA